jgi:hypothetical protein
MPEQVSPLHEQSLNLYRDNFSACTLGELFRAKATVLLQNKVESLFEIAAGFSECFSLRVHTGDLFHPGDIPAAFLLDYGCEFSCHAINSSMLTTLPCEVLALLRFPDRHLSRGDKPPPALPFLHHLKSAALDDR